MNAARTSWRSLLLAGLLAAVLLYFAFSGVDWDRLLSKLSEARPFEIGVVLVAYSVSYFGRACRWGVLLSAERRISPITMFWATIVGYLANDFLPARAGELIRTAMLSRRTGINIGYVLATALTERIVDAAVLVTISMIALANVATLPPDLTAATRAMAVVGIAGLVGLLLAPRFAPLFAAIIRRLPVSGILIEKLIGLMERFLLGCKAIQHPGRASGFLALTAIIWCIDTFAAIVTARSLGLELSIAQALILIAALGLSSAAPSTPGYVGIYQAVAVAVLVPFGFLQADALAFILLFQALTFVVVLVWGSPAIWRLSLMPTLAQTVPEPR